MSLYARLISRAESQEDEAAPLRLTPKDRGLGSGIATAPAPNPVSRQETDAPEEARPTRAAPAPALHRVEEEEDAPAAPARTPEEEDSAPAAKRMMDAEEPEAAPRRMETKEEDPAPKRMETEEDGPAPKRMEAGEEARPRRQEAPEEPEAAPLRRLESGALPPEQPVDELRHDSEGQALAARRPAQAAAPPMQSPTAPAPNISEAPPFAPAFTPPPVAEHAPSSAAPAPRPKVHIDQIDVIIGAQGGQASPAPAPSGARALLARRYVRGA